MKKFVFGLLAIIMFGIAGNAQTIKDFSVNSQTSITKSSKDGFYEKFVNTVTLPTGIQISKNDNFTLYTLNDENYQIIEVPVLSDAKIVNFMFVVIDLKLNSSRIIFKNHQSERYEFFNENLDNLYSFNFSNKSINFTDSEITKPTCYQLCRTKALAQIEQDPIANFACSLNPCGISIAIYCGVKCKLL